MINLFGKSLAFLQVGLSVMLMALALALYLDAVDFGWEQPARSWHEAKGKKGDNLLVPSLFDKREATMRMLARAKRDELARLGNAQDYQASIAMVLGGNHLKGEDILDQLENGAGTLEIKRVKLNDSGALADVAFPALETPVPGINMSYAGYQAKLKDLDARIDQKQAGTDDLLKKELDVTRRLGGKMDKDGKQVLDKSGSVIEPGWYYLIEAEYQAQRELQKELEFVQPLWVKEVVDAQGVLTRRDSLMRRLEELGDKGYLTQSEFLKKLQ